MVISSTSDGPYIFYLYNGKVQVIVKNENKIDTIIINQEDLQQTKFKCTADSTGLPAFTFHLMPALNTEKSTCKMPSKLLAVSDIEGNFGSYYKLLVNNGVMNKNYRWTFGKGHLVVLGDLVDRGNNVTQCLWLTYKLQQEAEKHGGQVHYLLGNHEQFLLMGVDFYANIKYKKLYSMLHTSSAGLYSDSTELGRWMRTRNTIIKVGDIVFVHGGIHPFIGDARLSMEEINKIVQEYIDKEELDTDPAYILLTGKGILWYRGFVESNEGYSKITKQELGTILKLYSCRKFVIGHTPVDNVSSDMEGTIIRTDVDHYTGSEALYIENNKFYRVNSEGRKLEDL